jgi:hypothetical protein
MKSMFKSAFGALVVMLALCGLTAASALAASAPTAETKPVYAEGITETTAVANGTVNPNGAETEVYAEYGLTTGYGSKTKEHNAGSGTKTVGESWNVSGLTRKTTYHIRVVATNSYGTSYGADETFTTAAAPEVVALEGKVTELKFVGSGGEATIGWEGNKRLVCSTHEMTGHFINAVEVEGKMKLNSCFSGSYECSNGAKAIETEPLKGKLGYTNKANKEVGLVLEGASSNVWAKNVNCGGVREPVTGKLASDLVIQANKRVAAGQQFTIKYQRNEADEQLAGELKGQLYWVEGYYLFGLGTEFITKANLAFEIKA